MVYFNQRAFTCTVHYMLKYDKKEEHCFILDSFLWCKSDIIVVFREIFFEKLGRACSDLLTFYFVSVCGSRNTNFILGWCLPIERTVFKFSVFNWLWYGFVWSGLALSLFFLNLSMAMIFDINK